MALARVEAICLPEGGGSTIDLSSTPYRGLLSLRSTPYGVLAVIYARHLLIIAGQPHPFLSMGSFGQSPCNPHTISQSQSASLGAHIKLQNGHLVTLIDFPRGSELTRKGSGTPAVLHDSSSKRFSHIRYKLPWPQDVILDLTAL